MSVQHKLKKYAQHTSSTCPMNRGKYQKQAGMSEIGAKVITKCTGKIHTNSLKRLLLCAYDLCVYVYVCVCGNVRMWSRPLDPRQQQCRHNTWHRYSLLCTSTCSHMLIVHGLAIWGKYERRTDLYQPVWCIGTECGWNTMVQNYIMYKCRWNFHRFVSSDLHNIVPSRGLLIVYASLHISPRWYPNGICFVIWIWL